MKGSFFTIAAILLCCNTMQGQFNTIGTPFKTGTIIRQCYPSGHDRSLEDSIQGCDTIAVSANELKLGKDDLISQYLSVSLPLKEIKVNSEFGMRMHPVYHKYMMHNGIDLHARHEDVLSMLSGKVIRVAYNERSGNFVTVQTGDFTISYCHLAKHYVKMNDVVKAGEAIGLSGNTGASTGEHLHITTKKDGKAFNPVILLDYVLHVKERCVQLLIE